MLKELNISKSSLYKQQLICCLFAIIIFRVTNVHVELIKLPLQLHITHFVIKLRASYLILSVINLALFILLALPFFIYAVYSAVYRRDLMSLST